MGVALQQALNDFQDQLREMVQLAHRDPAKALCMYMDASDASWSRVVTQCDYNDLDKDNKEQKHQPLAFLGAAFRGSEEWWTTFEKEAYAIYQVFKKMDYLFMNEEEMHVYTDHHNLLFVFNPLALDSTLGRHIVNKVQRWGLYLSRFSYVIEHIEGKQNFIADIMTRWWRGYSEKRLAAKRVAHVLLENDIVKSPMAEGFSWPSIQLLGNAQNTHIGEVPTEATKDTEDALWKINGKMWIPDADSEIQLKLLVVVHCGASGNRARKSTRSILKESYY